MEAIPVKMRRLEPPQDDLVEILLEVLPPLKERDVIVIASKVVAIDEGRCVPRDGADRAQLIAAEGDHIVRSPLPEAWDLTVKNDVVAFAGGIDESNAGDYIILLPEKPMDSAQRLRDTLRSRFGLTEFGVVITDSAALPFRKGVLALSIGYAGFDPVNDRTGIPDLFGRDFKYTFINVADALAVAGGFAMGETNESMPACILRNVPYIQFTDKDCRNDLHIEPEEDIFYPLFKGTVY